MAVGVTSVHLEFTASTRNIGRASRLDQHYPTQPPIHALELPSLEETCTDTSFRQ